MSEVERLYGLHAVLEALRARRRPLHRLLVRRDLRRPAIGRVIAQAHQAEVAVEQVGARELAATVGEAPAQGVVLEAGALPLVPLSDLWAPAPGGRRLLALDGVEDPQNLGAIARVAEAAGVGGLILTRRRSAPLSPAVARASAGAIEWLPAARVANLPRAVNQVKDQGFWVIGADPAGGTELFDLEERLLSGDLLLALGAEGRGLRPGVRSLVDHLVRIPMRGRIESLNVSSAAAVLLFELERRRTLATPRGMSYRIGTNRPASRC